MSNEVTEVIDKLNQRIKGMDEEIVNLTTLRKMVITTTTIGTITIETMAVTGAEEVITGAGEISTVVMGTGTTTETGSITTAITTTTITTQREDPTKSQKTWNNQPTSPILTKSPGTIKTKAGTTIDHINSIVNL